MNTLDTLMAAHTAIEARSTPRTREYVRAATCALAASGISPSDQVLEWQRHVIDLALDVDPPLNLAWIVAPGATGAGLPAQNGRGMIAIAISTREHYEAALALVAECRRIIAATTAEGTVTAQ